MPISGTNFKIARTPANSVMMSITRLNFSGSTNFKTYVPTLYEQIRNGAICKRKLKVVLKIKDCIRGL
jgi:hypothetical protein